MRLIDADALLDAVKEFPYGYRGLIQSVIENQPTIGDQEFEWCHDCKEYDQDAHCCHRWTKVIRQALDELHKTSHWLGKYTPYRCDNCGHYSDTRTPYCAYCGSKKEADDDSN